jgi:exopolysaccharide biosynthesis polyprenyl glycosylphosphotransferase
MAVFLDLASASLCLGLAYVLRDRFLPALAPSLFTTGLYAAPHYLVWFAVAPPLRAVLAAALGLSSLRSLPRGSRAVGAAVRLLGLELLALAALAFALHPLDYSRALISVYLTLSVPALWLRHAVLIVSRRQAGVERRVAILGCGRAARALERWFRRRDAADVRCLGIYGPPDEDPRSASLPQRAAELALDEVVLAAPAADWHRFSTVVAACREVGLAVRVEPRCLLGGRSPVRAESFCGLPTLVLKAERAGPRGLALKRALDLTGSVLFLILCAPLLLAVALAVLMSEGPPILFRQVRIGRNGRRFVLLKFRTMGVDAEHRRQELETFNEAGGAAFKLRADPRVTRLGRWLRRLSLDELPQLWNVLRGDMSFVGPRPPLPEEVARYEPWQHRRLRMPPGLTGPAQVCGRSELPFEEWIRLDLQYVEGWSLGLDARILLRTIPAVISGRGAY